jgi:iron complex outermembrane receptor protein
MVINHNFVRTKIILFFLYFAVFFNTAQTQTLMGTVIDEQELPLEAVTITIPALGVVATTKSDGKFIISQLPLEILSAEFSRTGLKKINKNIDLSNGDVSITIVMRENLLQLPAVTVTAKPQPSSISNTAQSVSVLEGRQLEITRGQSALAAIQNVPGVSVFQSGPFGIKPAIRGLSFQRIVILEDGLRHESQQWDEDDSPGIDAFSVNRIEVVKGPSSLFFGSDALGGVVNVLTKDLNIEDSSRASFLNGNIALNGFTNNHQLAGNALFQGGIHNIFYQGAISVRRAGNASTPEEQIENSGAEEINGNSSIRLINNQADIGISYSIFNQKKYLPLIIEEENTGDLKSYQRTRHDQVQFRYIGKTFPTHFEIRGGLQNNDAAEYEDAAADLPKIRLALTTFNIDTRLHHFLSDQISGTLAFSIENLRNKTLGEDPLIPNYNQLNLSGVVYEELDLSDFNCSVGFRYDIRKISVSANEELRIQNQTRSYNAFTGMTGMVLKLFSPLSFALNTGLGWRSPLVQELFVNGIEEGSVRYKVGNPNLKSEKSIGIDFSTRYNLPGFQAMFTIFYHLINHYIYLSKTNDIDSTSGAYRYEHRQTDAIINGYELALDASPADWMLIHGGFDIIWGKNNRAYTWLPYIMPARIILGSRWNLPNHSFLIAPYVSLQAKIVFPQNQVDTYESPTPGYSLFDLGFGFDIPLYTNSIRINGSVENIFNKSYHDHLNLYKEYFLNTGINTTIKISIPLTIIR